MTWLTNPHRFGVPFAGSTYWEIVFLGTRITEAAYGLSEIEMAESPGGADVCTGGTPYSFGGWSPSNHTDAFNNSNAETIAIANAALDGPRIGYQFPTPRFITHVRLWARNSAFSYQLPIAFAVRSSNDGIAWDFHGVILDLGGTPAAGEVREYAVAPTPVARVRANARLWRIRMTARGGGGPGIWRVGEMVWARSVGGAQVATGGAPWVDQVVNNQHRAFDGNNNTDWAGGSDAGPHQLGYIFPAAEPNIAQLRMSSPSGEPAADMPGAFTIDWSVDGLIWSQTDTYSGITWTTGETKNYTVSP